MARKQKSGKAGPKALGKRPLDTVALAEAAARALERARYKEAVELYKELSKRGPTAENREALAEAYAGRAKDLAGKGMLKEAIAVWRSRAELCSKALMEGPYPEWLRRTGDVEALIQAYRTSLSNTGAGDQRTAQRALEASLAAHVLAAPEPELACLPEDSPLMQHRVAALTALAEFANGGRELDATFKTIPFRSPYRDLVQILKALVRGENDPVAAREDLGRISPDSPFVRFAAMATTSLLPANRWLPAVLELTEPERARALAFKRVPESTKPAIEEMLRLGLQPTVGMWFDWLLRKRDRLPQAVAADLCLRLLPQIPDRMRAYRQAFGPVDEEQEARILALHAESRHDERSAIEHWRRAIEALRHRGDEAVRLRIALILRHMADLLPCLDDSGLHPEAITWLAESLVFDPDEVDVYLRLLRVYRAQCDLKSARALLDDALRRFPANAKVLLEAIETALASDAFKKAVGYAHKVLELDPINPQVRSLLGQAHLAHARKQLKSRKIEAARKELDEAGAWLRAPADQATLKLLQSLCEFQDGETTRGQQIVREAFAEFGSELVGCFRLAVESVRLGRDPAKSLREAGIATPRKVTAEHILALMHGLDTVAAEPAHLRKVIALLLKPLKSGASQFSREADFVLICENCHRHGLNDLALTYAEAARKLFRSSPAFVYHAARARYGAQPWSIPDHTFEQLESARDLAEQTGDRRTVVRIDRLLMMPEPYFDPDPMPFLPGAGTPFGQMPDPLNGPGLDMLMALLGEQGLIDFARNALGKKAFQEMERELGKANLIPALKALLGSAIQQAGTMPTPKPGKGKAKDKPDKIPNDEPQRDLFDD